MVAASFSETAVYTNLHGVTYKTTSVSIITPVGTYETLLLLITRRRRTANMTSSVCVLELVMFAL
jgi:hypothetical protein